MKPLADSVRPSTLDEVYGQDHLVGEQGLIRVMLEKNELKSMILYGNPGCGKTTIAKIIVKNKFHYFFNAANNKKADLVDMINNSPKPVLIIIDEIHRMKTDVQDYLLPYLENGEVIIIGLTSHNPYYKVNPAIRSRVLLLKINDLDNESITKMLASALEKQEFKHEYDLKALEYLANASNNEARTALNFLEAILLLDTDITLDLVKKQVFSPNLKMDFDGDKHYDNLSGLQKSIRGSDVDAALYYAAKIIVNGDIDSLIRRLLVIGYEDIGLANPELAARVINACKSAEMLGLPEARIPLGEIICELALSPKSNASHLSFDAAIADVESGNTYDLPNHLKNPKLYKYPHDYPYAIVDQTYLPSEVINKKYFISNGLSKGEKQYREAYKSIEEAKKAKGSK